MLTVRVIASVAAVSLALAPIDARAVQEPQPQAERQDAERSGGIPPLITVWLVSIAIIAALYLIGTAIDGDEGEPVSP
jgi:hypothetical protein